MAITLREISRSPQYTKAVAWLLKHGGANARYKTLVELQGKSRNSEAVKATKRDIPKERIPHALLEALSPDGYWSTSSQCSAPFPKEINDRIITVYLASLLAEYEIGVADRRIANLRNFLFSIQHPSGAFVNLTKTKDKLPVAVSALAIYSLVSFGVPYDDTNIQRAYEWLTNQQQKDGSFLGVRRKRCFLATTSVLMALSQNPELRDTAVAKKASSFLADGLFEENKETPVSWTAYRFPQLNYDLVKTLFVLATLGHVSPEHEKVSRATAYILERKTDDGTWENASNSVGLLATFLTPDLKVTLTPQKGIVSDMLTFKVLKAFQQLSA